MTSLTEDQKNKIRTSYKLFLSSKGLSPRGGQQRMIAEISKTLGSIEKDDEGVRIADYQNHICVVEAGTGTGKTLSYLIPSIIMAKELGKKLVVSTATVALQEQIVNKDIPDLLKHSGLNFTFSLMKGRSRYLCLTKINDLVSEKKRKASPFEDLIEENERLVKDSKSLYSNLHSAYSAKEWNGEQDTLKVKLNEKEWSLIANDRNTCTGAICPNYSSCSFFKERAKAQESDCLVANHDIVLSDQSLGGGVLLPLPEETIYIFDEAHHLPDKCLQHFSASARLSPTKKWLDSAESASDLLSVFFEGNSSILENLEKFKEISPKIKKELSKLSFCLETYSVMFAKDKKLSYHVFKGGKIPSDLFDLSKNLDSMFQRAATELRKIKEKINRILDDGSYQSREETEDAFTSVSRLASRAESFADLFFSFSTVDNQDAPPVARWIEPIWHDGSIDIKLCSSPISAAKALKDTIWSNAFSAILASATLRTLGSFQAFINSSGIPSNNFHVVQSPFNFSNGVLTIPKTAVEGNNQERHTMTLIEGIPEIICEGNYGKLVLFSSWKQMREVYDSLDSSLKDIVLLQGEYSKQDIIDKHKSRIDNNINSVIFGLASFAEGVDLPGAYCGHVVVSKLPFSVPDNPIESTRSDWIELRGGNPFMEISVPDASIKLIQYTGRLLRTESDSGKITIFDKRLVTKRYGQSILNSLPPYSRQFG